jgi:hypothetical protein
MENNQSNTNGANSKTENNLPGYPEYSADEDIYNQFTEEKDIDPEDTSVRKEPVEINTDNFGHKDDLDVPGSELDDIQENIGNEDEENNYYSLGGDAHDNLEEDQGE